MPDLITSQLQQTSEGFYIGLYRESTSSDWKWTDNTPTDYDNWRDGEPSSHTGVNKNRLNYLKFMLVSLWGSTPYQDKGTLPPLPPALPTPLSWYPPSLPSSAPSSPSPSLPLTRTGVPSPRLLSCWRGQGYLPPCLPSPPFGQDQDDRVVRAACLLRSRRRIFLLRNCFDLHNHTQAVL